MKTSLRRLRGALHKHEAKEPRDLRPLAQKDELSQASQDMKDMRDCYDSLLSAAAATANSAYEFSESLRELGACLLEKTALNDDEESGRVLLMLGKVQFELQKLVDNYRSHIFQTITIPSESLLNELQTVEEMKRQCDEKRNVYDYMLMRQREKGWSKGETMQQLQEAHNEYDEEATLFVFRLKSLKQGQSRSLLTQAARHHAAQLCFFKKALKSLEEVEPHVKQVTEEQHIDYHFSGLEDDYGDDDEDGSEVRDDEELSFDYRENDQDLDAVSAACGSLELDHSDITFPQIARTDTAKENLDRMYRKSCSFRGEIRAGSQSAPLSVENNNLSYPSEKPLMTRSSLTRKFNTYVLPTPVETKSPRSSGSGSNTVSHTTKTSISSSGRTHNLFHSSPLEPKTNLSGDEKVSRSSVVKMQSVLRESNKNTASSRLPPLLSDGILYSRLGHNTSSDLKKIKRQSFSGPLTSKQWPSKPVSTEPQLFSGPILRNSMAKLPSSSPRISPDASRTVVSSPKISELHELPRPPNASTYKSSRVLGYSAPLVSKGQLLSTRNKPAISNSASPLPIPPPIIRSFSIPSSSHKVAALDVSKPTDDPQKSDTVEDVVASPPLTPMFKIQESSTGPEPDIQIAHTKGAY